MLYLAWDREINISLFFCDVFVWKWGPRPRTSSRCYHGNKSAAPFKKGIFVHPPWVPNCMQNLKGGWKFSSPKMFDSYRDLLLSVSILRLTRDITFNHNCLEDFLTFRFMAWKTWKYCCSKLLPRSELTYQMNVTENESILSWWEWWTSCGVTEVWRTPALWRIYFIRWRFLHNITWLNSHRTGQDLKKIINNVCIYDGEVTYSICDRKVKAKVKIKLLKKTVHW